MMKNISIQRVSNYGTSHPVVARLRVQSHELLGWADLPKDKQDLIISIYDALKNRLLKCHEGYARLKAAAKETLEVGHVGSAESHIQPYLIGRENEAETFLYESKNYFRDLLRVINVFFGTGFHEASNFCATSGRGDGKVSKWAGQQFGPTDSFTGLLRSEQAWIGELIRKRNAVEHPGQKSGALTIKNFQPAPDGLVVSPSWYRDSLPPTDVLADIDTAMDNMLTLAEDVLVACITKTAKFSIIDFTAIPEKDRNPKCPIRIRVQLRGTGAGGIDNVIRPR
jgi:hypothetical protein